MGFPKTVEPSQDTEHTIHPGDRYTLAQLTDAVNRAEELGETIRRSDFSDHEWQVIVSLTATIRKRISSNETALGIYNTIQINHFPPQ